MKDLLIVFISFVLFNVFAYTTIAFSCWFHIKMTKYVEKELDEEEEV